MKVLKNIKRKTKKVKNNYGLAINCIILDIKDYTNLIINYLINI